MIIFPAIDIQNGTCVRLTQGDFSTAQKVAACPVETALGFKAAGAEWVHMVDLDGAKAALPQNSEIFIKVVAQSGLKVQVGGGIRNMETIEYYLGNGISRVILGSAAVKNPAFVKEAIVRFGERVAVGIDAKNKMVAAEGWLDASCVHYIALAKQMESIGVRCIIFTDISKDGTLQGPNLDQLGALAQAVTCDIIASGGIKDIHDIGSLRDMKLYGAICGKSLYHGTLSLKEAIEDCRD